MLSLTVTFKGVDEAVAKLRRAQQALGDRAIRTAVNKTADQARTQMSRAIREEFAVSAAMVNERLRVRRAISGRRASFSAVLIGNPESGGRKRAMNLIHFLAVGQAGGAAFKTRGTRARKADVAGVGAQLGFRIKRAGGIVTIPGAFVGNKGRTVFRRIGKERLPIKALRTVGVPQMFATKRNIRKIESFIRSTLPRLLNHEVRRLMATIK